MKKILFIAFSLVLFSFQAEAQSDDKNNPLNPSAITQEGKVVKLKVTGMTCSGCANHVFKVLKETKGVLDNYVEYPGDVATVQYDPEKITPEDIIKAIEKNTTYKAELKKSDS